MLPTNGNGKVYVGIPRERIYIPTFVDNRDKILAQLHRSGRDCGYFQAEGHRVDRNRDKIVLEFLKQKDAPEWLLMIDTDMEHPIDLAERLVKWNKPVVGGLYFHRGSHDPFAFVNGPETTDLYGRKHRSWVPMRDEVYEYLETNGIPMRDGAIAFDDPNGLVECDAVATGAILIHRSVLQTWGKGPWFEYEAGGISEDLAFCARTKEEFGFPIFCDFSTISGHYQWVPMGQAQFRMDYLNRGINLTAYSRRHAGQMFAQFFDMAEDDGVKEVEAGDAQMVSKLWRSTFDGKTPTPEEETAFYASDAVGKAYIIELLHWNYTPQFKQLCQTLTHVRKETVVEIGSGIGSMALQMIIQNNNTTAVELNPLLRRFIAMRYEVISKNVETDLGALKIVDGDFLRVSPDNQFTIALAFDVLEHLPENELRQLLATLNRVLVRGGHLLYHGNWYQQDIYPMHHDYSNVWPKFLAEAGFTQLTKFEAIKL